MPTGYFNQDIDGYLEPVVDTAGGIDMWWDIDSDGMLVPLPAELSPTFPSEDDTTVRAGTYGWSNEFTANFVVPTIGQVLQLVNYGAHGTEYTGTLIAGTVAAPATPALLVTNVGDGKAATVVVQLADAGTTNRLYVQQVGHYQNPRLIGTVIGNGTATVYPGYPATYCIYCLSTIGNSLSAVGVSNVFELSGDNAMRDELQSGPALAHYEVCKILGKRISFKNLKSDPWVGLWALDISGDDTVSTHGGETSVRRAIMEIPRQAGWPPPQVNFQATIKIPETAADNDHTAMYGVENLPSINNSIGITPVFRVNLKRYDVDTRLGG